VVVLYRPSSSSLLDVECDLHLITNTDKKIESTKWMPEDLWDKAKRFLPIACVDVIFENRMRQVLFGYRKIRPYNDVWALPGGRMLYGENLGQTAKRVAGEYGISFNKLYLVGVFPVSFKVRSDVSIALAAPNAAGNPKVDGKEFSKFVWRISAPSKTGGNYKRMIEKWRKLSNFRKLLELNRID
jgi:ADP-ribose pyrophosphatase YjhB (NUDIX family)